ncbi:mechanosensitive ion channel protein MscS [Rugosimonospora africana]|uniref:Mechanosensitive ion channel protein MscS n=2 Tax=Rugosimonospora africana TaxID=556532 RepID=A0A8J3QQD0_9ACTN|nr:mechanosensitive ion channel protein MscS [Rugosimonospora africana]
MLVALAGLAMLAAIEVLHFVLVRLGRRIGPLADLARRAHRPFQILLLMLTLDIGLRHTSLDGGWRNGVAHLLDILAIAAGAWLLATMLLLVEDAALSRFRTDVLDNRSARTVHTQIQLLRRITVAASVVAAIIISLFTFREARLVGTSLLASAGVVAAVVAFAAQALLGNVFAGLQLAFGEALRLEDVVVIDGQWGRVEEITLTYVVVHIWDDRRLVLPTSYFTTTPFENWTRTQASLLGTVELDLDWSVPVEQLRDHLRVILTENEELWDGRVCVLQVTDAVHALVRVRALVSARDAPTLWDLRCLTRERLVGWLRAEYPQSLPRLRTEMAAPAAQPPAEQPPAGGGPDADSQVFGGDPAGRRRGNEFTGPDDRR